MYRILSASKDTYITNKVINSTFRATDANTGKAGTLDLFKLYDESVISGTSDPVELSRILIQFDLDPLRRLTGSSLDMSHSSFKCFLKMHDVYGGETTPSNFKVQLFPLSRSFDEGFGTDIIKYQDIDSSNFVTSSIRDGTVSTWYHTGANMQGLLGSDDIDIISSGNLSDGNGVVNLWKEQSFTTGEEDLLIDITTIVSGTVAGQIPDRGFRISFSESQETDTKTRFVKRFASRDSTNSRVRPKIVVKYDDSVMDHHKNFFFNLTGSLFLNNFHRGSGQNILTGTKGRLYGVSGSNCLLLRITSGSKDRAETYFTKTITGSQHKIGSSYITGVYSATFSISEFATATLRKEIISAGSATFNEYWGSLDGTVGFFTSTFIAKVVNRSSFSNASRKLRVDVTNMRSSYLESEKVKFRVFVEDTGREIVAKKKPIENISEVFQSMFYRVRDFESNDIIVPFDTQSNGTKLSSDSHGMYFTFYMDSLDFGRVYIFDFLIKDQGFDQIFTDVATQFRVE
tara:strand:- start:1400 stop:2944 length:1545 start_codon:yes stop_codon:yes gene_type:complete